MLNANDVASLLSNELGKYGTSDLRFSRSLFSGESSDKAGIFGEIKGTTFKVIMFEPSNEHGLMSVSAHLTADVNAMRLSDDQMAFWNADNRFTKMYRQDENHAFLVMDSFFSSSGEEAFVQSVARMWSLAMAELSRFKMSCERRGIF